MHACMFECAHACKLRSGTTVQPERESRSSAYITYITHNIHNILNIRNNIHA